MYIQISDRHIKDGKLDKKALASISECIFNGDFNYFACHSLTKFVGNVFNGEVNRIPG